MVRFFQVVKAQAYLEYRHKGWQLKVSDISENKSLVGSSRHDGRSSLQKEMCLLFKRIKDFELFESKVIAYPKSSKTFEIVEQNLALERCFDANTCIRQIVHSIQKRFPKHQQIKLSLSDVPLSSHCEFRLRRVLHNIILNAMQASKPTQQVTVHTYADNGYLCFEVFDKGCGISAKNLQDVFSPFFTSKKGKRGTGLGLAISQQIVHEYNGTISLTSSPNIGTQLRVKLPLINWYLH